MQFYDHETVFNAVRKTDRDADREKFYRAALNSGTHRMELGVKNLDAEMHLRVAAELGWEKAGKPYYNIWPGMLDMLLGLDLAKVPVPYLKMPSPDPLLIRLPVGHNHPKLGYVGGQHVSTILVISGDTIEDGNPLRKFVIVVDFAETAETQLLIQCVGLNSGLTLSDFFEHSYPTQNGYLGLTTEQLLTTKDLNRGVLALLSTICLIARDPELVIPDVLAKDRDKFERETDQEKIAAIVDRARRRGKFGWDIGKGIETAPHWRKPHPALVWTGKGRSEPKIVLRKGSIVHREKITEVPTGYAVDEEPVPVA